MNDNYIFSSKTFGLYKQFPDKNMRTSIDSLRNTINKLNNFIFEDELRHNNIRAFTTSNFWSTTNNLKYTRKSCSIENKEYILKRKKLKKNFLHLSKVNEINLNISPLKKDDDELDILVENIIAFTSGSKIDELEFNVSNFSFEPVSCVNIASNEKNKNESFYLSDVTAANISNNTCETFIGLERKKVKFSEENVIKYYTTKTKILPYRINKIKKKEKKIKPILKNIETSVDTVEVKDEKNQALVKLNQLIKECELDENKNPKKMNKENKIKNTPRKIRRPLSEIQNTIQNKSIKFK